MASTDFHLTLESARGEMRREGKDQGIDVHKFEYAIEVARDGASGQSKQRRRYTDMKFFKLVDSASPTLQTMLATNAKIKKATLSVRKSGGPTPLEYFTVILSDAYISSYKIVGADFKDEFGALPRDEFTINFRKIEVEYKTQGQDGGVKSGSVNFMDEINVA